MGTFLGVPIIRTIVFLGLYWGSPILGNYHIIRYIVPPPSRSLDYIAHIGANWKDRV